MWNQEFVFRNLDWPFINFSNAVDIFVYSQPGIKRYILLKK